MSDVTRRELLGAAADGRCRHTCSLPPTNKPAAASSSRSAAGATTRLRCRSSSRACAEMGLTAVDLLNEEEWTIAKQDFGLACSTGFPAVRSIPDGLNDTKFHDGIVASLTEMIPKAAKAGIPNVICFFGNRRGRTSRGEGNSVACLNRIKPVAEAEGVTVIVELLNSKVNHKDYMATTRRGAWSICKRVGSPRFKLLYDIYHMQIMEGDVIRTMGDNQGLHRPLPHRRRARAATSSTRRRMGIQGQGDQGIPPPPSHHGWSAATPHGSDADASGGGAEAPHRDVAERRSRPDPYYWLGRHAQIARRISHLEAENAYTEAVLAPVKGIARAVVRGAQGPLKQDDEQPPGACATSCTRAASSPGKDYAVNVRRRAGGAEQVLVDQNALPAGTSISPSGSGTSRSTTRAGVLDRHRRPPPVRHPVQEHRDRRTLARRR